MGGTFMSMPEDYRNQFIAQLHNALSGFTGKDVDEAVRLVSSSYLLPLFKYLSCNYCTSDTQSEVNRKPLASRSRLGPTIA